jgi:hypothetical protein
MGIHFYPLPVLLWYPFNDQLCADQLSWLRGRGISLSLKAAAKRVWCSSSWFVMFLTTPHRLATAKKSRDKTARNGAFSFVQPPPLGLQVSTDLDALAAGKLGGTGFQGTKPSTLSLALGFDGIGDRSICPGKLQSFLRGVVALLNDLVHMISERQRPS